MTDQHLERLLPAQAARGESRVSAALPPAGAHLLPATLWISPRDVFTWRLRQHPATAVLLKPAVADGLHPRRCAPSTVPPPLPAPSRAPTLCRPCPPPINIMSDLRNRFGQLGMEALGTFFLVATISISATTAPAAAPIAVGVILASMIYAGGHVSGAHYNPGMPVHYVGDVWLCVSVVCLLLLCPLVRRFLRVSDHVVLFRYCAPFVLAIGFVRLLAIAFGSVFDFPSHSPYVGALPPWRHRYG